MSDPVTPFEDPGVPVAMTMDPLDVLLPAPVTKDTKPPVNVLLVPDAMATDPPFPPLVCAPPANVMRPPPDPEEEADAAPDIMVTAAPSAESSVDPTTRLTLPDAPASVAPVMKARLPELPLLVVPVPKVRLPLTPSVPAFGVRTTRDPDDVPSPRPDEIVALPPMVPVDDPAVSTKRPPAPDPVAEPEAAPV